MKNVPLMIVSYKKQPFKIEVPLKQNEVHMCVEGSCQILFIAPICIGTSRYKGVVAQYRVPSPKTAPAGQRCLQHRNVQTARTFFRAVVR